MATKAKGELKVTLKKSTIGCPQDQKDTAKALGLKKTGATVIKPDNDAIRGQIFKIKHLLEVEEVKKKRAAKPKVEAVEGGAE